MVTVLLKYGADVNASTTHGYTPLMQAANNGSPELVRLLLNHRPDLGLRNDEGQSALEVAKVNRSKPAKLDVDSDEHWTDPITIDRARRRHNEIIRLLETAETVNSDR